MFGGNKSDRHAPTTLRSLSRNPACDPSGDCTASRRIWRIAVGAGLSLAIAFGFTLVVGFLPSAVFDFARHASVLRL